MTINLGIRIDINDNNNECNNHNNANSETDNDDTVDQNQIYNGNHKFGNSSNNG